MKHFLEFFFPSIINYLHEDGVSPVFVLDSADHVNYYNQAFQSLIDIEGSLLGRDINQLLDANLSAAFRVSADSQKHKKVIWHVKTVRGASRFKFHIYFEGDRRLVFAENLVIAEDDMIAKMGSLNLELMNKARDLTKRNAAAAAANQKLQAEIAETMAQAERLSVLATMAAGVAHEITQPLNSIKLAADSAVYWYGERQSASPDDVISDMTVISQQADRIAKIILHMRALVYKQRLEVTACDLNAAVGEVFNDLQSRAVSADIHLSSCFTADLPPILGNAIGIGEVVTNLVTNSFRALNQIDQPRKVVSVCTSYTEEYAVLEVTDNGPGIAKAIRERIFEPFFTTDPTANGMGLGLSIVQAVVTAHNGSIAACPHYPKGTTFRVTLPLFDSVTRNLAR